MLGSCSARGGVGRMDCRRLRWVVAGRQAAGGQPVAGSRGPEALEDLDEIPLPRPVGGASQDDGAGAVDEAGGDGDEADPKAAGGDELS